MIANAGIAVAKFVAYLVTGSASMLAESIHSVADTSNQGLLILGSKRAQREADDEHQFGYGRERFFWAFVVALVLFTLGGLFSIFEGIEKIRHPHEVSSLQWAIGVLLVGILLEGFALRTAVVESRKVKGDRTWWQFIRRSRAPELPVVLLEDIGAMIGLVLALIGVGLTALTGDPIWDGIGTLCIGVLLVIIAITLTIEMQSLLIGESANRRNIEHLDRITREHPSVARVLELKSQHIGPEELLVCGKIEFRSKLAGRPLAEAIDDLERRLRDEMSDLQLRIYLEPDLRETAPDPA